MLMPVVILEEPAIIAVILRVAIIILYIPAFIVAGMISANMISVRDCIRIPKRFPVRMLFIVLHLPNLFPLVQAARDVP